MNVGLLYVKMDKMIFLKFRLEQYNWDVESGVKHHNPKYNPKRNPYYWMNTIFDVNCVLIWLTVPFGALKIISWTSIETII
jgi:hypothetical protein